jgi:hypothetical protein
MFCTACNDEIPNGEARWDGDLAYCDDCFSDMFNYCSRCDCAIRSEDTSYDDDGNPYCDDCYDNDFDSNAPNNPHVSESDRNFIVELSRNWLTGKTEIRRTILINNKDLHLKTIKEKVSLVTKPIYLFGLKDRDEYSISASPNIIEDVKEYLLSNNLSYTVIDGIGCNRLGVSLCLREDHINEVIGLIKAITSETIPVN